LFANHAAASRYEPEECREKEEVQQAEREEYCATGATADTSFDDYICRCLILSLPGSDYARAKMMRDMFHTSVTFMPPLRHDMAS